uniref:(northern house mosquito) hypothetical protein n=1 Tax=Culex pipiens TaxID=7175 RepID=A0A8D8KHN0_CULPI
MLRRGRPLRNPPVESISSISGPGPVQRQHGPQVPGSGEPYAGAASRSPAEHRGREAKPGQDADHGGDADAGSDRRAYDQRVHEGADRGLFYVREHAAGRAAAGGGRLLGRVSAGQGRVHCGTVALVARRAENHFRWVVLGLSRLF